MPKFYQLIKIFLLTITLLIIFPVKSVWACPSSCNRVEDCRLSECSSSCFSGDAIDCSLYRPTQSAPTDSRESITGKIFNPVLPENLSTLQGTAFLSKLLRTGISLMFVFGSIIFLFILTSGGVKWLSSSGDKVKLESAQKQITSGLTGLAILLTTFVIIQLVQMIFGIDLLNITLPTL